MGRRFILQIGIALAVAGMTVLAPSAVAFPDDSAPRTLPPAPAETAKAEADPSEAEAPAELPQEILPANEPGNLGPKPGTAGPAPREEPRPETQPRVRPGSLKVGAPAPALPAPEESLPVPAELPAPGAAKAPDPAPLDPAVEQAQAPAASTPAPAALPADAGAGAGAPTGGPPALPQEGSPSFVLPAERLPIGRQNVGLTVEVLAPQVMNLGQSASLKVVVRNNGSHEAQEVVVRDMLPDGLDFISSQPEPAHKVDSLLTWSIGTLAAGAERSIALNVKPSKVGAFDHGATVSMKTGGRSRTMVREPKLKIELNPSTTRVLRGQPVEFKIAVTNTGDGPARRVKVQVKLSPGLVFEAGEPNEDNIFEQTIDLIPKGERIALPSVLAETKVGGEQSCLVAAQSPDVIPGAEEAKFLQKVVVTEPKLAVTLTGPKDRFTDNVAKYDIVVENPGSATAKNVKIQATVPLGGRLFAVPAGARFDPQSRKLTWTRPQLEPGEKGVVFSFEARMVSIGLFNVAVEARGDSGLYAPATFATNVAGLAVIDLEVKENLRVVDIGDTTVYKIQISNNGTKAATGINVSAELSKAIEPRLGDGAAIGGTDVPGRWSKTQHLAVFPQIPQLAAGKMIELYIRVKAVEAGPAICRVVLTHDDLKDKDEKIEDVGLFKVTTLRR
jgi:uncharacterized repeat protein (TIGR01451 family)